MPDPEAEDILHAYVHLQDGGRATLRPLTADFWPALAQGAYPELEQGRLMTAFSFSEPWSSWERHPAGEELVMLLSGAATLVLDEPGGERAIPLDSVGAYVLVPRGVWHTAKTEQPTTLLFITPGAGTEHRPV
ncbi:cupin domain-containing protein [Roseateles sp. DAIF2]|uniref:cupin domain-containing protein n=1 Tax=Roseateles sp. DAIF2 TaxID=2714952 RepID=UPI0018A32D38|nr:cupin domain-containing protein [Roseateles sp. DAIF2]QPF71686.1 cupin domain-containing protein [Roseateles sp. DAIF2]